MKVIPYLGLSVKLHSCVPAGSVENMIARIKYYLVESLDPEYKSDIEVELEESAGDI